VPGEVFRRDPCPLPVPPEQIILATKIYIGHWYLEGDEKTQNLLYNAISVIDSFTPRLLMETDDSMLDFMTAAGMKRTEGMYAFRAEFSRINPTDPIFWQRVYTLLGVPYSRSQEASLWTSIKKRFWS
jgi:hypothetical protein